MIFVQPAIVSISHENLNTRELNLFSSFFFHHPSLEMGEKKKRKKRSSRTKRVLREYLKSFVLSNPRQFVVGGRIHFKRREQDDASRGAGSFGQCRAAAAGLSSPFECEMSRGEGERERKLI